jgi:hypothetical protein
MRISDEKQRPVNQKSQAQHELSSGPALVAVEGEDGAEALVTDGFLVPNLDSPNDAEPPAYGAQHDHVHFSQPGFDAGAEVTGMCLTVLMESEREPFGSEMLRPQVGGPVGKRTKKTPLGTRTDGLQSIQMTAESTSVFTPKIEG